MELLSESTSILEPLIDKAFGWQQLRQGNAEVLLRGYVHGRTLQEVAREALHISREALPGWLNALDGHFSIILTQPNGGWAAVDPVRSYPLCWSQPENEKRVVVSNHGPAIEDRLGLGTADIDCEMASAFAMSGYTIGNRTLYKTVRQLGPGEFLSIDNEGLRIGTYYRWEPWKPVDRSHHELTEDLSKLNHRIVEKLANSANGRRILVPLSAGLDSRFIASGLKHVGYTNVQCVAYGRAGNREATVSQDIAERLGFDWTFVEYTNSEMAQLFRSEDYARYVSYSDSLTAIHFPQEYFTIQALLNNGTINKDIIVVNGQAGDFIAGNHIPAALFDSRGSPQERCQTILQALLQKHYKNWSSLMTEQRLDAASRMLAAEIDRTGGLAEQPNGDHGIYEWCEFQDRQSKYVLNGQRTYEFEGLEWRLPLWDREYLDFWECANVSAKQYQNLYKSVLTNDNWAGVWHDVPINPSRIRPLWLVPIRQIAKALHAPLGKSRWHVSERQYFEYFMAPTCIYAKWPYWQVASDGRGHYGGIAWHVADYLTSKGLTWDGRKH